MVLLGAAKCILPKVHFERISDFSVLSHLPTIYFSLLFPTFFKKKTVEEPVPMPLLQKENP